MVVRLPISEPAGFGKGPPPAWTLLVGGLVEHWPAYFGPFLIGVLVSHRPVSLIERDVVVSD